MKEKLRSVLKSWPPLYHTASSLYWRVRGLVEHVMGTKIQETYWARRHLSAGNDWNSNRYRGREDEWVMSYWDSQDHSHRRFLFDRLSGLAPISSLLEVGCNCGPNLYLIAKKFPHAEIRGIDINQEAVRTGNTLFAREGMANVNLRVGKADELNEFGDRSFDVVLTDAVLIYIGPDKIKKVIKEMVRITRRALVLVEWHCEPETDSSHGLGVYHSGHWKRNYVDLLKQFVPEAQIRLAKIPPEAWPDENWGKLGHVIEVRI
jgi:ubiquinone/menaquinone biosynthesis C-methylase UbiE